MRKVTKGWREVKNAGWQVILVKKKKRHQHEVPRYPTRRMITHRSIDVNVIKNLAYVIFTSKHDF